MSLEEVLGTATSRWMAASGPAADIVLSSRVRLARNLRGVPFPTRGDAAARDRVIERVTRALPSLDRFGLYRLRDLSALDRQVLVEKHLISPLLARGDHGAVVLRDDEAVSVMVLEEDHVRLQVLQSGLQLQAARQLAGEVDAVLEERLSYAWDEVLGYLTTSPANVGTGLRASVMVHLPGLVLSGQAQRLLAALGKVGVVARGLYGEGSTAMGNLFQISNQVSLGPTEEEIIENLSGIAQQVVDRERASREWLSREMRDRVEDRVARAYGVLTCARLLASAEAMQLLSDLRLGIDLGVLRALDPRIFNRLIVEVRPGFLQKLSGAEAVPERRDAKRAALIRKRLREIERRAERGRTAEEA